MMLFMLCGACRKEWMPRRSVLDGGCSDDDIAGVKGDGFRIAGDCVLTVQLVGQRLTGAGAVFEGAQDVQDNRLHVQVGLGDIGQPGVEFVGTGRSQLNVGDHLLAVNEQAFIGGGVGGAGDAGHVVPCGVKRIISVCCH